MPFDYITLKIIWWAFVGVLLIGFAVTDGFDLGVGMLLPFVGRNDGERRILLNAVGPTWEGNQTWLITAGAASFAAWPLVYAAAFSGLYIALMLMLFALFMRPVGFDYRSKIEDPRWRSAWDWALFVGGAVPSLILGVAFGNLLHGLPFAYDNTMRIDYRGDFFDLLNPAGLVAGVTSVCMLLMHGASFLATKTDAQIAERARRISGIAAAATVVVFILGAWVVLGNTNGFEILNMPDANSSFMPVAKHVGMGTGLWTKRYAAYPWLAALPVSVVLACLLNVWASRTARARTAFIASGFAIAGIILTAASTMFPFIMPSTLDPNSSLTIWDAVSSKRTLGTMFWVVVLLLPIVIGYTSWVYGIMRGKVTAAYLRENEHSMY